MAWPVFRHGGQPTENDGPGYWGRFPPTAINILLVAGGGQGFDGGGGGGGVIILNNYATGFVPHAGPPLPQNKLRFLIPSRSVAEGSGIQSGINSEFYRFNSSNAVADSRVAIGGGYGASSTDQNTQNPGGSGGSGGGSGSSGGAVNGLAGGSGTPGQGNSGGSSTLGAAFVSPCLYIVFRNGSGGGYSQAGSASSNSFLTMNGASGGQGLSLSGYLSSSLLSFMSGSAITSYFGFSYSLSSLGLSGYGSTWVSSGAGGSAFTNSGSGCNLFYGGGSGGPGAGSNSSGATSATGFGCGACWHRPSGTGSIGRPGGGLAVISYSGTPADSSGITHYDQGANMTYHLYLPPSQNNQYFEYIVQF